MTKGSPVEDVAKAIAETVLAKGWGLLQSRETILLSCDEVYFCRLTCKDASQAKRLLTMMQQAPKPARGVFDAMGIDPVDPLDRFPSIRVKHESPL